MFKFTAMAIILASLGQYHLVYCSEEARTVYTQEVAIPQEAIELAASYIVVSNSKGLKSTVPARKCIILKLDQAKSSK